jgi:cytochrome P450
MLAFWRDPPGFLLRSAREHGDVVRIRWGRSYEYLLNGPEHTHRVLVAEQRRFMKGQALQEAKRILGEGLLTAEGSAHLRHRRLIQPLFHHNRITEYARAMVDCADRAARRWRAGERLDVQREMSRITLDIVGRTVFAANVEAEANEIGAALTDALDSLNLLMLPLPRVVDALPLPSMRRLRRARARLDRTIYGLVRDRRADDRPGRDLLSLLVAARDDEGVGLSDEQVRDEAMTLFLAGHETTAMALTWTWFLLSRHPDVEARMHQELGAVVRGRLPTAADLPGLRYTSSIVREVVRLYPPAWLIGRRALDDFDADGYRIPAGSIVILSPFVSHRDPRWFPEPDRFDPDRWADDAPAPPRQAYFPFGAGTRACIGEGFAWTEAVLVIATLAQRWRLRAESGYIPELLPRITLRPKGRMPMTVEPRPVA